MFRKSSQINVSIYKMLGQKIKTLVNDFQNAGKYSIVWDATNENNNPVSSGIYFYQLRAEIQILQRKMLLLL